MPGTILSVYSCIISFNFHNHHGQSILLLHSFSQMRQLRLPTIINSDCVSAWLKIHHKQCSFCRQQLSKLLVDPWASLRPFHGLTSQILYYVVILRDDLPFHLLTISQTGQSRHYNCWCPGIIKALAPKCTC